MSAHDIVSRLDHCKPSGKDQWMARCPAHDDRGPSLSIKDAGDGRTLIHCFAGCGAIDILSAIGLEVSDLYPPTDRNYHAERKQFERTTDELVIEMARADRAAGKVLSYEDREREAEAFARIMLGEPSPEGPQSDVEARMMAYMERQAQEAVG